MKTAPKPFIAEYPFRIDGSTHVCSQHEKAIAINGSHFGEFRRSGDHTGIAQARPNFPQ
jgi:hypothetical protein